MMVVYEGQKLVTAADLRALEALPENADKKFELIAGEIFDVTTGTLEHAYIILLLASKLLQLVLERNLGHVFTDTVIYQLSDDTNISLTCRLFRGSVKLIFRRNVILSRPISRRGDSRPEHPRVRNFPAPTCGIISNLRYT